MTQDPMTHSDTSCQHAPTPPDSDPANPTKPPGEPCASTQLKLVYLSLEARATVDLSQNAAQNDINWKVAVASLANILQHHLTTIRCANDSRYVHAEGAVGNVEQPGHILFTVDLSQLHDSEEDGKATPPGGLQYQEPP